MLGGDFLVWEVVQLILEVVFVKVDCEFCVVYMGKGVVGYYVKMVYNGIEYGMMQFIVEIYDFLCWIGGFINVEIYEIFSEWNKGLFQFFFVEIIVIIFV